MSSPVAASELIDGDTSNLRSKKVRTVDSHSSQDVQLHDFKPTSMQRYLVTVEYIGSRYFGFQKQKSQDCRTVQGALEEAFFNFVGKPVESAASSRTDAGVHALRNACHVDVERVSKRRLGEILPPHQPEVVKRAMNHFLQKNGEDVQVVDVQCVPPDFHARFQAKERIYHYRILVSADAPSIFEKNRACHVHEELDIGAMQAKSPVRTLDELHVCEMLPWPCFPSHTERSKVLTETLQHEHKNDRCSSATLMDEENPYEASIEGSEICSNVACNDSPLLQKVSQMDESKRSTEFLASKTNKIGKPRCYVVTARARSFLYHQVRLMVGLLKAVGTGGLKISDVQRILEARTVTQTPPMAPACGLYLADVKYDLKSINTRDAYA